MYRIWREDLLNFQGFTSSQMQMAEENTRLVLEREKEVHQIVRSISDLNEIFKDLATMVVDQVSGQIPDELYEEFRRLKCTWLRFLVTILNDRLQRFYSFYRLFKGSIMFLIPGHRSRQYWL